MTILELPFDIEHPDVKAGFRTGQQAIYHDTRPDTDMELVKFMRDFMADEAQRLAYNVGFLLGLYHSDKPN
ncbi:hypothetical protein [Ktedonobacter racemifer]|uniref:Uncharacterized protein n=1 Tax=Ktedonobacter racemifer DSM 44963 TaxID=485913 RepID=D6TED7_KTERA|nr:hypothetical protein [Ktedonobacter racemifer]EFH90310.1 hypothetical protein Krac_11928 [Ktedonobacter racemifer DSM 44963]